MNIAEVYSARVGKSPLEYNLGNPKDQTGKI
jgi:hypothetical protein